MPAKQIEIVGNYVYFIYPDYLSAEEAFKRLRSLKPHICSKGGRLNALVVDMRKMPTQGEMQ